MAVIGLPVARLSIENLPAFPPAAARLMSVLANDNVSFGEVAKILMTDAALSAEVLRLANSPLGGRFGSSTILHALSLLGIQRVSGLVVTLGMSNFLKRAASSKLVRRSWRHNLASALVSKQLAQDFDIDPDQAYLAVLLHDVGRLVLLMNDLEGYEGLIPRGDCGCEQERQHFGIDHCEAGAWLITEWRLPQIYAKAARLHHGAGQTDDPLIELTHSCCEVANRIGFSFLEEAPEVVGVTLSDQECYTVASTINAVECEYGFF